ncbi:AraC family transcriptional regulator [Propionimicrobium sp. PCR01-08-3]|uniref:helix-turn-helix transcriptional regulator n=1 Tax=Propionimicrobium sp. PCR01-08-3 TaxID=3052086 RepID=UPI00255C2E31|nr:AraC family transcriptional regulator [Propionimicrobium sp. PCR01-08-3]WIY81784.1 AraC family transcriptional regulator [Propionimicrobium sp. PCR01-08-3]
MFDQAEYLMSGGNEVALARAHGVNDNMSQSHYHTYFEMYYLESGTRNHVAGDHLYRIESGEMMIFPPFVMHHSYGETDVRFKRMVVYFAPEAVLVPEVAQRLNSQVSSYRVSGQVRRTIDRTLDELAHIQDVLGEFQREQMRLLITDLLINVVRQTPTNSRIERTERMTQVIRYLHDHHDEQLTLDRIASEFHISQYYLCREFKKLTHSTIMQYVNNVRIGRAQRLLNETGMSVTQISKQVGFANVTHFNRVFRQVTAMSPTMSRRNQLEARMQTELVGFIEA